MEQRSVTLIVAKQVEISRLFPVTMQKMDAADLGLGGHSHLKAWKLLSIEKEASLAAAQTHSLEVILANQRAFLLGKHHSSWVFVRLAHVGTNISA